MWIIDWLKWCVQWRVRQDVDLVNLMSDALSMTLIVAMSAFATLVYGLC